MEYTLKVHDGHMITALAVNRISIADFKEVAQCEYKGPLLRQITGNGRTVIDYSEMGITNRTIEAYVVTEPDITGPDDMQKTYAIIRQANQFRQPEWVDVDMTSVSGQDLPKGVTGAKSELDADDLKKVAADVVDAAVGLALIEHWFKQFEEGGYNLPAAHDAQRILKNLRQKIRALELALDDRPPFD